MISLKKLSRRDFLKICTIITATMGLPYSMVEKVSAALKKGPKPSVIWLHLMECTGCSETLLRASHPDLAKFLLEIVNVEYHETLMAAAGVQAEEVLEKTMEKYYGNYICVVEGAVPTKDNGIYCKIGNKTALELLKKVSKGAKLVIAYGSCSAFGGVASANPNPTGAVGINKIIGEEKLINIPGCPPSPYNLLSTISYLIVLGKLPELGKYRTPKFAYGRMIHDHCERRPHFDEGRFVEKFGDEGHKKGYCLYKVGCKGPITFANCSVLKFCDIGAWPVGSGHPCMGCTMPDFWDKMKFYKPIM